MATANSSASAGKRWSWALLGVALFLLLWTAASLRIGNPVLLSAEAMRDCAALSGDRGARKLIEAHMDRVIVTPVTTRAIFADFDAPEDFT